MKVGNLARYKQDFGTLYKASSYGSSMQPDDTFIILDATEKPHHQFGDFRIKLWCFRRQRKCLIRKEFLEVIQ